MENLADDTLSLEAGPPRIAQITLFRGINEPFIAPDYLTDKPTTKSNNKQLASNIQTLQEISEVCIHVIRLVCESVIDSWVPV